MGRLDITGSYTGHVGIPLVNIRTRVGSFRDGF